MLVSRSFSATSPLPTRIFLLLSSARHSDTVGECVAGLTFLCKQSEIAPSFSRLLRISSRATVRRDAGEPFLLVRYRPRTATQAKKFIRRFERCPVRANRQAAEE